VQQEALIQAMAGVAEALRLPIELDETLEQITGGAVATIPGIDHASISVTTESGQIRTLAPTDPVLSQTDDLQVILREGPCLNASMTAAFVQVDDLADDARWPLYGPNAASYFGLRSLLAFQFRAEPHARGALNLYAERPHQIDVETRQLGAMFARLTAIALGWVGDEQDMTAALVSRNLIGQAVGIVMERYRLDADRAFDFLVRTSRSGNAKVQDVAAALIAETIGKAE
jgi:hypothetical protein